MPKQACAISTLPYDLLLQIFEHLADIPLRDALFDNAMHDACSLAERSLSSGFAFWSLHDCQRQWTALSNCSLVCRDWHDAALDVMQLYIPDISRTSIPVDPQKVRYCTWQADLQGGRERIVVEPQSAPREEMREVVQQSLWRRLSKKPKRPHSYSPTPPQITSYKDPLIYSFVSLRALLLSVPIIEAIAEEWKDPRTVKPLAALTHLRSLAFSNFSRDEEHQAHPANGRSISIACIVNWLAGTSITSLEMYDPLILPSHIPETITAASFPSTLVSLVLLSFQIVEAPSFAYLMHCLPNLQSLTVEHYYRSRDYRQQVLSLDVLPSSLSGLTIVGEILFMCNVRRQFGIKRLCLFAEGHLGSTIPWLSLPSLEFFAFSYHRYRDRERHYGHQILAMQETGSLQRLKRVQVWASKMDAPVAAAQVYSRRRGQFKYQICSGKSAAGYSLVLDHINLPS